MKKTPFAILALLLIVTPSVSSAATILVPGDQPTIQAGIDGSSNGDLILVGPGTYAENIDFLGKAVTLRCDLGAEVTVIDGGRTGSVVTFSSGEGREAAIEGFTIQNGSGTYHELAPGYMAYCGGGVFCLGSSPRVSQCVISRNGADHGGGIFGNQGASPAITSCTITENQAVYSGGGIGQFFDDSLDVWGSRISDNSGGYFGGGIYFSGDLAEILNCMISGNQADSGGGVYCNNHIASYISHCTIVENTAIGTYGAGGGVYYDWYSGYLSIMNSILWNNSALYSGAYTEKDLFGPAAVLYSAVEGGPLGIGVIDSDPLFAGPGDFHLTAGSPCIDAGMAVEVFFDMDGDPRPSGCGYDIGADENPDCHDCDGDHYPDASCGGGDCDDADPMVNPGAGEICTGGIDDDCDGLTDVVDPDCFHLFTNDLVASHEAGTLSLDFTLGLPESALWAVTMEVTYPTQWYLPLWEIQVPVILPPAGIPIAFPCPSVGWVGIHSSLYTGEGLQSYEFSWVFTGWPSR